MNRIRFLSLALIIAGAISAGAQVQRVEPPNWWVGMNNPELQLMLVGEDLAGCTVKADGEGVRVTSSCSVENPTYLFVNLLIDEKCMPGEFRITLEKESEVYDSFLYELRERQPNAEKVEGFNSSDVVYLLMPDRFANGDPSNDIVKTMRETALNRSEPYGRHGGDLQGIIDHLDYISNMGFTALWLNPVLENDQPRSSYHGYAITDFYKVDPRFGTNEMYRELADQAREKGIKLIMDMVFNHCGSKHWWMENLPSSDWINYSDGYRVTNHRRTVNQDPYAAQTDIELMRDGWFVPSMPDLNQRNPFMATYLVQNSIWWIEYLGLAGIRMDTYPYPDKNMMDDWCRAVLSEYPDFNIVGEEWTTNPLTVSYWQKGQVNKDGYEPGLPTLMDFPLQDAVRKALTEEEGWNSGLIRMYDALSNDFIYPDPFNLMIFPDNHDMSRFYMQLGMQQDLYKMGITYFLTSRGIPQIYYGSEILMTHTEGDGHGYIRKDFPGGWTGDPTNAFTGENLSKDAAAMQDYFMNLLNWRKEKTVIHTGKTIHFTPQDGVYVYARYNDNETVMVVMNKNNREVKVETERYSEIIGKYRAGTDVITGKIIPLDESFRIPGKTALVLELNKGEK